ncbi:MAG: SRPBCC domain-containing protein, partial [Hymenobacteraceae bacterium]|nr:SRPBCC domain-containing protein [Hymenobacteraceae bacterium]
GSSAETDWQEGSKIHFLNGEGGGMYSVVAKNQPNEYMSIKHLGEVKDGKEQPISEEVESWSGSMENYRLTQQGNTTNLSVELDTVESFEDFMNQTFPKALEKVKELAETN